MKKKEGNKANGNDYIGFYLFEQENGLMEKNGWKKWFGSHFFKWRIFVRRIVDDFKQMKEA